MKIGLKLAAVALIALATLAQAADETGKGYVNLQGGRISTDNDRNVAGNDAYYGLGIGKHISERWSVEINGIQSEHNVSGGSSTLDLVAVSLDGLRVFQRSELVSPFLSFGAGFIENKPNPGNRDRDWMGQLGVGLLMDVFENQNSSFVLQVRPEIKVRWDGFDDGRGPEYLVGLGLSFAFGPEPRRQRVSTPPPQPVVQAEPEPEPEPDTRPEVLRQPLVLQGVNFETNSDRLTTVSRPVLNQLADELRDYPQIVLEVQGHTDSQGDAAYNLELSQRRAEAVRQYLASRGVAANRLVAKGFGEAEPIADNSTSDGRRSNRRVVLRVIDNPQRIDVDVRE